MEKVRFTSTEPHAIERSPDGPLAANVSPDRDVYEIVGSEAEWHVAYNGEPGMAYATKEAAFEAAFAGATNAVKAGHDVTIHVSGADSGESALGGTSPET